MSSRNMAAVAACETPSASPTGIMSRHDDRQGGMSDDAPAPAPVFLSWRDVSVRASAYAGGGSSRRLLLENATGFAAPAGLVAIMGPSGCGKTTLLNTLAGRLGSDYTMSSGEILANGRKQSLAYGNAAYVTQDDSLIATLSVHESLLYSARLQLGGMSEKERQRRVERCIAEMGLQGCVHTRVGGWHTPGLSGGEKRRLSIALHTLHRPRLLFLDEPTSGLDSAATFHVVKRLQGLAQAGRTILLSIHQPSPEVFGLFEHLCLVSAGRTVYFGETAGAHEFFDGAGLPCPTFRNHPDHFLRAISPDFQEYAQQLASDDDVETGGARGNAAPKADALFAAYQHSDTQKSVRLRIQRAAERPASPCDFLRGASTSSARVSCAAQAFWLTKRSFTNMQRDLGYYWLRLFMHTVLAFVGGTIFYDVGTSFSSIQGRAALFTFITAFMTFMGVLSFPSFVEDMKIFTRERLNGQYGVGAFVVANTVSSMPFLAATALLPGGVVYGMGGLHAGVHHFFFFFVTLLACLTSVEGLLMAVASLSPDYLTGMIAGCGIMGTFLLTGGFFRLLSDLPKPVWRYPISYLSFYTWTNKAFSNNDFQGLVFESIIPGGPILAGEDVLRHVLQMDILYSKWWTTFVLVLMAIMYRLLFFFGIKLRERLPSLIRRLRKFKTKMMGESLQSLSM